MPPDQPEQSQEPMPEPMLEPFLGYWQGEAPYFLVRMNDATLRRYMAAWLEAKGITEPTEAQTHEAFAHCRKVSYWEGMGVRSDPDVQTVRYPKPKQR
jgi:hypothetical protein